MNKENIKYIVGTIIFIAIVILVFKFIAWLLPYALVLLGVYLLYIFIIKVKDRSIVLNKKEVKKTKKVQEAEIVKEKNN